MSLNVQNAKDIAITEGDVQTIHDKDNRLLWGRVAYSTKYQGNTFQQTYTGKNLFNNSTLYHGYYAPADVTNLTASENYRTVIIDNLPAGTYTFSTDLTDCALLRWWGDGANNTLNIVSNHYTFTTTATGKFAMCIRNTSTSTITQDVKCQVESGEQATTYEPYVGGIPSPNPSYPQGINVATGRQTVSITGKNLFNINTLAEGGIAVVNGVATGTAAQLYTNFGPSTQGIVFTSPNEQITISATAYTDGNSSTTGNGLGIYFSYTDGTGGSVIWKNNDTTATTKTLTSDVTKTISKIVLNYESASSNIWHLSNFQIELGATATTYEAYQAQNFEVNLGSLELCKIGTYIDRIYKNNGNWYKHEIVGKVVLDGTEESWNRQQVNGVTRYFTVDATDALIVTDTSSLTPVVCDNFTSQTPSNIFLAIPDYGISLNTGTAKLRFRDKDYTETSDFKTWLGLHNTTVYYALATSTDIAITNETLISQLEAIDEWCQRAGYMETVLSVSPNLPIFIRQTDLS